MCRAARRSSHLQKLAGWETENMVRRYAHFAAEHLLAYAGNMESHSTNTDRQFAAAGEALRRALEVQPDSDFASANLGILQLLKSNPTEAPATFHKRGGNGTSFLGIAMAEYSLGHVKESQHALDKAIAKHAQDYG